jgi:hypothetical protein
MTTGTSIAVHDKPASPGYYCNARKRGEEGRGELCTLRAGWGTDHPGTGRCKLHGGKNKVKHGLYSEVTRHRVADRVKELRDSDDLLELREQIALQAAIIQEYLAGLGQSEELAPDDARTLIGLVELASKNVERLHKIEHGTRLTVGGSELNIVLAQVVAVVRQETDADTAGRIGRRLLTTIPLEGGNGAGG